MIGRSRYFGEIARSSKAITSCCVQNRVQVSPVPRWVGLSSTIWHSASVMPKTISWFPLRWSYQTKAKLGRIWLALGSLALYSYYYYTLPSYLDWKGRFLGLLMYFIYIRTGWLPLDTCVQLCSRPKIIYKLVDILCKTWTLFSHLNQKIMRRSNKNKTTVLKCAQSVPEGE